MNEQNIINAYNQIKIRKIKNRTKDEVEILVYELLNKMTLKEKIGQMYQAAHYGAELVGPKVDGSDTIKLLKEGRVGSVLSVSDQKVLFMLQDIAVNKTRLGIPLLFAYDVVHGFKTIFPINLALACTWNENLIEMTSRITASETALSGIHMTFAPMLDVVKDPRWGRVMESFGEDHYLGSIYAKAYVKGFQKEKLSDREAVAACGKHFIGYGLSEAGREYNTVDLPEGKLRNEYLTPFIAAIDEDIASIMTAFNVVDGIPATSNKKLLRDILKNELSFQGMVISDYNSSGEIIQHKIADNMKSVAEKCLVAGLDMEMVGKSYVYELEALVGENTDFIDYINDSVKRILTLKYNLGLFDDPFKGLNTKGEYLLTEESRKVARESSRKSIVLLENNGVLPLKAKQVGLLGPHGNNHDVNGFWSALGSSDDTITLKDGLSKYYEVVQLDGCDFDNNLIDYEILEKTFRDLDVLIMAIGEKEDMSGEGASRAYLNIPGQQEALFNMALKLEKKIITVVFSGRPLELKPYEKSDALIQGWFLGSESGNALAEIISGEYSPSGRLSMSFPYTVGQVPVYYNQMNTGRPVIRSDVNNRFVSRFIDIPNDPLYPFGYGLSYTTFSYQNISINQTRNKIEIELEVKNTGKLAGIETVQIYIEGKDFTITRPIKELKDYKQVELKPNEYKKVNFTLDYDKLSYYNEHMVKALSKTYDVMVGKDSKQIVFKKTISLEV